MVVQPPRTRGGVIAGDASAAARGPGLLLDLVSLTKPRVNVLVIATAFGGLVLAPSQPSVGAALLFLLATGVVVGSANALNCWMERDSDRHMARTRLRPLPAGRLSPTSALLFGLLLAAVSLPALALAANPLTALLGAIALVSYVCVYTPLKRRSPLAIYVGAIPGAMPPLMGWTAATGRIDAGGLSLFAILFLWQVPHWLAIATYRRSEYARAGLRALPVVKGVDVAMRVALVFSLLLAAAAVLPVLLGVAGWIYLVAAIALSVYFVDAAIVALRRADAKSARKLFIASLIHLSLLVLALGIDAAVLRSA